MKDLPLSGLVPGDSRNYLSDEARRRLLRAHGEAEKIQWEAEAEIEAKHLNRDGKKARYRRNQANLCAARGVLKVVHQEYSKLNLPLNTFWCCIKEEIEGAANSLKLYDSQRRLLEAEFFYPEARAIKTDVIPQSLLAETERIHVLADAPPPFQSINHVREALRDAYFAAFPEKIKVLDVCWAARQRYREWKRWLAGELKNGSVPIKDGSTPDRAFRAILTSGKRPEEYRKEPRPIKWQ
jgi:hypothetical protein